MAKKVILNDDTEVILAAGEGIYVSPDDKVTVIQNGNYGVILNEPTQDVLDFIKHACLQYGYTTEITNPDFDPTEEPSESNVKFIANPETQDDFARNVLRRFAANIVNKGRLDEANAAALANKVEPQKVVI